MLHQYVPGIATANTALLTINEAETVLTFGPVEGNILLISGIADRPFKHRRYGEFSQAMHFFECCTFHSKQLHFCCFRNAYGIQRASSETFLNRSDALVPPKPNELLMAYSTLAAAW